MQSMLGMMTTPTAPIAATFQPMVRNRKPEVTGPYPELARLALEITGDVTRRQAENHVGGTLSHHAIGKLWAGERVTEGTILRFAQGYGVDPNPLLEAAGYPRLPERREAEKLLINEARAHYSPTGQPDDEAEEIERIPDPEFVRLGGFYEGLTPERKRRLLAYAQEQYQLTELEQRLREQERQQAIGGTGEPKQNPGAPKE